MLRLALLSGRGRLGTFTGALVALAAAAVLTTAWGMQLESVLRGHPPVERYAGAAAVVTGQQIVGADHDVPLSERARVSSALTSRLAAVPGVRAAIGDVSVPVRLGDREAVAHGWGSAALTPYTLTAGRRPAGPGEVVAGYRAKLGARVSLASTEPVRTVTVVGVARPRHPDSEQKAIFVTDAEAEQLGGHPGRVDAIGVLAGAGFDASRLRAVAGGAQVLTGAARGNAEHPELQEARITLIPVTAAFAGLALFIAMFVVTSTMGLSIQQREREIALLRAVAATPRQIRRMIGWEAALVGLVGSAAGVWPGMLLGRELGHALVRHGIVPSSFTVGAGWIPAACAVAGGIVIALLAVLAAGRRAARVRPTLALTDAAVEPRLLGPGRLIGGLLALAGAVPLFAVSTATRVPETAAATSEMTAIMLVLAVGFPGPIVPPPPAVPGGPGAPAERPAFRLGRASASRARPAPGPAPRFVAPPLAALPPVGGSLAPATFGAAPPLFSPPSTPLVLSVPMSCP